MPLAGGLSRPAALAHQHAARNPLAVGLELLGDVDELGEVGDRHAVGAHQGDGEAHHGEALEVMQAVAHLHVAALAIGPVVERAHGAIEFGDDLLGEVLGLLGARQHHEVVAADVAQEVLGPAVTLRGLRDDLGELLDRLVAARVAVVVVEGLEEVDVDLQQRERLAETQAAPISSLMETFPGSPVSGLAERCWRLHSSTLRMRSWSSRVWNGLVT